MQVFPLVARFPTLEIFQDIEMQDAFPCSFLLHFANYSSTYSYTSYIVAICI